MNIKYLALIRYIIMAVMLVISGYTYYPNSNHLTKHFLFNISLFLLSLLWLVYGIERIKKREKIMYTGVFL